MKYKIPGCLFILFVLVSLNAQEISLQEALTIAKQNNRSYKSSELDMKAAEWQRKNAVSQFLPKISFNETAIRFDKETILFPGINLGAFSIPEMKQPKQNYTSEINVTQPLFTGGKLSLNYRISNLMLEQTRLSRRIAEQNLELSTAQLYFQILKINDLIKMMIESKKSFKEHYETALVRQKNGSALLSEVLQWKVKYEESESNLKSLQSTRYVLLESWKQHLGLADKESCPLPMTIQTEQYHQTIQSLAENDSLMTAEFLQSRILSFKSKNSGLKTLKLSKNLMEQSLKMSKTDFLPTLALNYNYQFENDDRLNFKDSESWKVIAVLSVPLFNSGSTYTAFRMKEIDTKKQYNELDNTEELMLIALKRAVAELVDLAGKIQTDKTNITLAEENKRQINLLFAQGLITFNEQIDAELLSLSVQTGFISDIYDYLCKEYEIKNLCEE